MPMPKRVSKCCTSLNNRLSSIRVSATGYWACVPRSLHTGTNIPSITSNYGGYSSKDPQDEHKIQNPKSVPMSNFYQTSNTGPGSSMSTSSHQYKKCHSASIPIYLSEAGFLKMISANSDNGHSPLEVFLASCHLKKILIKTLNNDTSSVRKEKNYLNILFFDVIFCVQSFKLKIKRSIYTKHIL